MIQKLEKESIINALKEIDKSGIPKNRSSKKFHLKYSGKLYPPKYVISIANKIQFGTELEPNCFSGGKEANNFLKNLNFEIVEGNKKI